jgi:photosystem II stability/assembly factor-like uncharacterized protein
MLDRSNGWALTDSKILKTTDGGVHWQNVTPAQTSLTRGSKADFLSSRYAWVVSTDATNDVIVQRTTDGGATWQSVQIADSSNAVLTDMPHFLNVNEGWLSFSTKYGMSSGILADIYHTTDGGQHWNKTTDYSQVANGLYISGRSTGISLKDANNIWYTEDPASSSARSGDPVLDQAVAAVSHDGGRTWQQQQLPTILGSYQVKYVTTPPVFIGQKGIMPVYVQNQSVTRMSLYISDNGGATWRTTSLAPFAPNQVQVVDAQHAYADTADGRAFATSDSGLSWQQIGSTGVIGDLDLIDNTNGVFITATSNQYLLRTSDGGRDWQRVNYTIQ